MKKLIPPVFFSIFVSLFACHSSLYAFAIPSEYARLEKKIEGTNGKTIFLIQEAHSEYQVQKNIAGLLRYLIQSHGLHLVFVEGGWGSVSLSYLRNYGSEEGRLKVAEEYLKSGKISAEEYLDITSDFEIELWGVEDPKLYEQNMKAFFFIHSEQTKWLSELSKLKSALDVLAEKLFPQALQDFRKEQEAFGSQKISLLEYLQFLLRLNQGTVLGGTGLETPRLESQVSPSEPSPDFADFPTLRNLMALSGEGGFDPEKVEWEKHELVRALSRKLTKPELEEMALHENRKTSEEELAFIQVLLAAYQREASVAKRIKVDHLRQYARSLEESLKMDSRKLFSELRALEDQTADRLAQSAEQKELVKKLDGAALLEKLFKLELGPEDFARLRENPTHFDLSSWRTFLLKIFRATPSPSPLPLSGGEDQGEGMFFAADWDMDLLQNAIAQAQEFYSAAEAREKAMIRNVTEKMDAQKEKDAVLISGGFHTERLSRAFQELGFSVVVLTPRFASALDSKGHQERYFQILKEKWEAPEAVPVTNLQLNSIKGDINNATKQ